MTNQITIPGLAGPRVTLTAKPTKNISALAAKACQKTRSRAFVYIQASLKTSLDKSIESLWSWPSGARDIVDTGVLKNSLVMTIKNQSKTSVLRGVYTAPYASSLHYGWVGHPYGNKSIPPRSYPGRPWVQAVLDGTNGQQKPDFEKIISDAFLAAWNEQLK